MPLPETDFDITEVALPWRLFRDAGLQVVFATPSGRGAPRCDPLLIEGPIFGMLGARPENLAHYRSLERDPAFCRPLAFAALEPEAYDALVLPGGHAPGMRPYLEDGVLQGVVARFSGLGRPIGAICHGTLVLARCRGPDGHSLIAGRTMTCLPAWMELSAWALTAWKLGRYYRTYDQTVQAEVKAALGRTGTLRIGPPHNRYDRPFVVRDGNLVSARWPGDAQAFAAAVLELLGEGRAGG